MPKVLLNRKFIVACTWHIVLPGLETAFCAAWCRALPGSRDFSLRSRLYRRRLGRNKPGLAKGARRHRRTLLARPAGAACTTRITRPASRRALGRPAYARTANAQRSSGVSVGGLSRRCLLRLFA